MSVSAGVGLAQTLSTCIKHDMPFSCQCTTHPAMAASMHPLRRLHHYKRWQTTISSVTQGVLPLDSKAGKGPAHMQAARQPCLLQARGS